MNRRHFVKAAIAVAASRSTVGRSARAAAQEIPYRPLGRTGEKVSAIGVGGFHLSEQEAIVRGALDAGLNFLDNSWDYADGKSEEREGKALKDGYRARAFLMTKIDGRTAKKILEQVLKVARGFKPLSQGERAAMLAKTK